MRRIIMAALLLLGAASFAQAQEEEDYSFPVKFSGKQPVISDFVTAILSLDEIGESLGSMSEYWDMFRKGQELPAGHAFLVDTKNGYLRYDVTWAHEEDSPLYTSFIEFCYWNFANGKFKLVAENQVDFRDGEPFMGQYAGTSFYLYDCSTHRMGWASAYDLGLDLDDVMPEDTQVYTAGLPRTGKTVRFDFYAPSGNVKAGFTWNGKAFVKEK